MHVQSRNVQQCLNTAHCLCQQTHYNHSYTRRSTHLCVRNMYLMPPISWIRLASTGLKRGASTNMLPWSRVMMKPSPPNVFSERLGDNQWAWQRARL
jgi:hypothetical protein